MRFDPDEWKYRWEQLGLWWRQLPLRRWVNQHPRLVVGIAAASMLVFLVIVISLLTAGEKTPDVTSARRVWFYDLNANKLFAAPVSKAPPIAAPSGPMPDGAPAGVRAYVFTYGHGDDQSEPVIGYLETRASGVSDSAYHAAHEQFGPDWGKGLLVRRVDEPEWVAADDPAGRAVIEQAHRPDEHGRPPQPHFP